MRWNGRTRCALVCIGFVLLFSAFSFRLIYLQLVKHDEYAGLAAEKHVYKQPIYAERGAITDANGEVLAHNVPVEIVVADTSHLNKEKVAEAVALLSRDLKIDADELWGKLGSDRHYIVLKRDVPESAADALRAKLREENLRGIFSNTMPRGFIPTGRCFVMSLDLPIAITRGYKAWKHRWTNICTGRTAIATSNTIALARRSCFIADRNAPHGMVTRSILPLISICRISSRTRSMPRCANTRRKKPSSFLCGRRPARFWRWRTGQTLISISAAPPSPSK